MKLKDQYGEIEFKDDSYYELAGQYQTRFSLFGWGFIITLVNYKKANEDFMRLRKEQWEKLNEESKGDKSKK